MFLQTRNFIKSPFILNIFELPILLSSVSFLSSHTHPALQASKDTDCTVSNLIKKPNWEQNTLLKSLVSHITPHEASRVIQLHSSNTDLGVRFFSWVCRQSTYCYDIDSRIHLLKLIVSSSLYVVAHKAIVGLIKECFDNKDGILKLMVALDELREFGFRLNYPCYSTLLMCLAKLDMGFVAYEVYKRMVHDGFVVGGIDYKTLINALCKTGLVQGSEMFLCRVLKLGFGLDAHICTSLVLGYCRISDLLKAFKVFEIMSKDDGCGLNSVTYSTLIHGLCQASRLEEAFGLKEEMVEKGCQPSARTYTVLIKALCDVGSIDKPLSLLGEMVAKGCKPNVYTYTVLIDGLCREGKIEEANGMFKRMLTEGLFAEIVTYNALINGYCKEGWIISAFELLCLMERRNCKPNMRTYNELMEGLCRINESYKAMLLLRKVIDNGLFPNSITYNILINGFCKEGQLDMAFKIFNSMNLFNLEPDAYTLAEMIDGLCKKGKPDLANGILGLMVKKGILIDEVTFTALINGFCQIGKIGDALRLFEEMILNACLTTPHVFNSFLDVLCKENKLKEAYTTLGKILKHGLVPSVLTYTILIYGLFEAGKTVDALSMLEVMKQAGCPPNVHTYSVVINGLCQNARVEEAERLLYSMSDLGVSPNHVTYTILVKAHVKAGRLDRALEIVSTMVRNGCRPNSRVYSAVLTAIVSSDKASEAVSNCSISHFKENYDEQTSNIVLREMVVEHALKLQELIKKCGGEISDLYNYLVVRLCKVGRIDEADLLIKEVVESGVFPDQAISSMIEWYCMGCKFDDCLEFVNFLGTNGFTPSFSSYCLLVRGLHGEGKSQEAQRLVFDLLSSNGVEDKTAVSQYIEFLVNGNEPDNCLQLLKILPEYMKERPII